ncbi:hypothetical protein ACFV1L_25135 [Kitasatospora sp. NPDC059646]|uniref:hypothetical protein n=1 Tax=Kitasatospora sp. NPDC059646 TaxID=3346893 RepID=UPI0036C37F7A
MRTSTAAHTDGSITPAPAGGVAGGAATAVEGAASGAGGSGDAIEATGVAAALSRSAAGD